MKRSMFTIIILAMVFFSTAGSTHAEGFSQAEPLHTITSAPLTGGSGLFSDTLNAKNPIAKIRDNLRKKQERKERDEALARLHAERTEGAVQNESQTINKTNTISIDQKNMDTQSVKIAFNNNDNKSHITNGNNNGLGNTIQKQRFESSAQTASVADSDISIAVPQKLSFGMTFLLIAMVVGLIVLSLMNHGKRRKMRQRGLYA